MYYPQDVVISPDETHVVCYGFEKLKNHIYVHATKSGEFLHKILVKYSGKVVVNSFATVFLGLRLLGHTVCFY